MHSINKQKIKIVLSQFLKFFHNSSTSKNIYYHDVFDVHKYTDMATSISLFKEHQKLIKRNGYSCVKEINEKNFQIRIMFDDGFRGIYELSDYFILNEIPATIFIITSKIGENNYLSADEIIELKNTGFFTFSSHTHSHNSLNTMNENEIRIDLLKSKDILEELLSQEIEEICFPRGIFSKKVSELATQLGFFRQFSSIPFNYEKHNIFENVHPRILAQTSEIKYFENQLRGVEELFFKHYVKKHIYD